MIDGLRVNLIFFSAAYRRLMPAATSSLVFACSLVSLLLLILLSIFAHDMQGNNIEYQCDNEQRQTKGAQGGSAVHAGTPVGLRRTTSSAIARLTTKLSQMPGT